MKYHYYDVCYNQRYKYRWQYNFVVFVFLFCTLIHYIWRTVLGVFFGICVLWLKSIILGIIFHSYKYKWEMAIQWLRKGFFPINLWYFIL